MRYATYTVTIEGPALPDAEAEIAIDQIDECVGMAESALGNLLSERIGSGWSVAVES